MFSKSIKKKVFIILGILAFLVFCLWFAVFSFNYKKNLEVVFFDVGQGDAIFIETPRGRQILIDGGPNLVVLDKLKKEMPLFDRTIDLIILSHPEKDHVFGLLEVLKRYKVKNIIWNGVKRDTKEWREWENLIKQEGAKIIIAQSNQRIILDKTRQIFIDIIFPFEKMEDIEMKDSNGSSIVARLVFGQDSFLFTGDITDKAEKEIILKENIDSDILKVPHHGSKYSSSEEFLKAVSPELAIICVGKNSYGHPSPDVLAKLKNFGIETLITKKTGDIKIISDGNNFNISNN